MTAVVVNSAERPAPFMPPDQRPEWDAMIRVGDVGTEGWRMDGDRVVPVPQTSAGYAIYDGKTFAEAATDQPQESDPAVNEKENDPHRLARVALKPFETSEGLRLRYYLEQFHQQEGAAYRTIATAEMRARWTAAVKVESDRLNREQLETWSPSKEKPKPPTALQVTSGLIGNVLQATAGYCNVAGTVTPPTWLDGPGPFPADEILACENGLVHLPTFAAGKPDYLIEPTPRFFGFTALDYAFDPNAATPHRWLDFLDQLWPSDPESIACLQAWFGYLLSADTRLQKILLLIGPRRGGKGTIARVLRGLIGAANVAGPTLGGLATNFGLWPLLNKPLAVISDARLSGRADTAIVTERLLSISGEDAITVDRKHLAPVTVKLPTRFVILTNELPRLGDSSGALAGRFVVLRMSQSWYGKEDHGLTNRLLAERSGILLWAIAGLRRLRDRGRFVQPASGGQLVRDLEDLSSPVGAFVREVCEVGPDESVGKAELYERWNRWRVARGMKETSAPIFGRDLRAAVPSIDEQRPRQAGARVWLYAGIGVRPGVEADDIPP
jgi:putative DNA primase/helicase